MARKKYQLESKELELLKRLIRIRTVNSLGGSDVIDKILDFLEEKNLKYSHRILRFNGVKNLVVFAGQGDELIALNGHYDVVPANRDTWGTDPFDSWEENGFIYGRGTCDMKGPLVSIVSAFADFAALPQEEQKNRVILMVVGDEEKAGFNGTGKVLESLFDEGIKITKAFVGEPNAVSKFGDSLKTGRRGLLWLKVKIKGKSGHGSSPHRAKNPLTAASKAISRLESLSLEAVENEKAPTSVSPTFLNSDAKATNVIPDEAILRFDIRYGRPKFPEKVDRAIAHVCKECGCKVEVEKEAHAAPFINPGKEYEKESAKLVEKLFKIKPQFEMHGGSSDARFFSMQGIPTIEMGPVIHNVHGSNEKVSIEDLAKMKLFVSRLIGVPE